MLKQGEDVNEGDARYLASELLNDVHHIYILYDQTDRQRVHELTKSDIFSLGSSMLELILNEDLPKNGQRWHKLREGLNDDDFGHHKSNSVYFIISDDFSQPLKDLIIQMMQPEYQKRPSASDILVGSYFKKDKETNLKWEQIRGTILRRQLDTLINK